MFALRLIPSWLTLFLAAVALAWCILVDALPRLRRVTSTREEDLSDWLKRDVGLLDGRDMAARLERSTGHRGFPGGWRRPVSPGS